MDGQGHTGMSGRGWLLFAAVSVLWGMPYALIKVAVEDGVPPATLAVARALIGAIVLLALAWRAGVLGSVRGRIRWLIVYSLAELAVPFPLLAFGERHVSSSLAAILIATAPLFVALLALRVDASERIRGCRLAGLVTGMIGVVALVGIDIGGRSKLVLGAAAVLLVALGYAVAPLILRRHLRDLDPRASMGASLAIAALLLAPAAAIDRPAAVPSPHALEALLALGLFCTAAALSLYGALVVEVGAGRALVVTYLNPVVAVLIGVSALGERPGPGAITGLVLILAGAWFATGGRAPSRTRHLPPAAASSPVVAAAATSRLAPRGRSSRSNARVERC
jgi:drug/metabolite transporter (DMT)-like permease